MNCTWFWVSVCKQPNLSGICSPLSLPPTLHAEAEAATETRVALHNSSNRNFSAHTCTRFLPIGMERASRIHLHSCHDNSFVFTEKKHKKSRFLYCGTCLELRCFLQEGFYKRWDEAKSSRAHGCKQQYQLWRHITNVNIGGFIEIKIWWRCELHMRACECVHAFFLMAKQHFIHSLLGIKYCVFTIKVCVYWRCQKTTSFFPQLCCSSGRSLLFCSPVPRWLGNKETMWTNMCK